MKENTIVTNYPICQERKGILEATLLKLPRLIDVLLSAAISRSTLSPWPITVSGSKLWVLSFPFPPSKTRM